MLQWRKTLDGDVALEYLGADGEPAVFDRRSILGIGKVVCARQGESPMSARKRTVLLTIAGTIVTDNSYNELVDFLYPIVVEQE